MKVAKLRVTVTIVYDANMEHYPDAVTFDDMARTDADQLGTLQDVADAFEESDYQITVEALGPVSE